MSEEASDQTKPQITIDDFAKLDLRVGTVTAAEPHPNADKLLKLRVDLGPLGERQLCAGIRPFHDDPQDLVGRQIAVVTNLEPRKIRGEESNGMLLAASVTEEERLQDVVLLSPERQVPSGAPIS